MLNRLFIKWLGVSAAAAVMAAGASSARAMVVEGYGSNPSRYTRFDGFDMNGNPIANPSFMGDSYDLSGVGWTDQNDGSNVALVSPQSFITTVHDAPSVGSTLYFLNRNGVVKSYTIASYQGLQTNGQAGDLDIGTLTSAIPSGDDVSFYSVPVASNSNWFLGKQVFTIGHGFLAGTNTIQNYPSSETNPPGQTGVVFPTYVTDQFNNTSLTDDFTWNYNGSDGKPDETGLSVGDSGSPTLMIYNGQVMVLGEHEAIDGSSAPYNNFDAFLPDYITEADAAMGPRGFADGGRGAGAERIAGGDRGGGVVEPPAARGVKNCH